MVQQPSPNLWKKVGLLGVIVADLVAYTGIGVALGYVVCLKLGAPKWVLFLTSTAGLCLAFYQIYQISKREESEELDSK